MNILKSLLITCFVSLLFAYGLRNITGFWEAFALSFALQFVVAFVYSSFKITKEDEIVDTFQAELDELLEASSVMVECPCGKNRFVDTVFVGIENLFDCSVCGSTFKTDVTLTPTLMTEPINVNKSFEDLVKEKEL